MRLPTLLLICCVCPVLGCQKQGPTLPDKAPRPVSVLRLQQEVPVPARVVTGSVGAWKTEDIGFEVAGRIVWVIEPGRAVEGRILDAGDKVVTEGTPLAKLDDERYRLTQESAELQVDVATLKKSGIEVQIEDGIPADRKAAEAELELAQIAMKRTEELVGRQAASDADLDKASAELKKAESRLLTLDASLKQRQAELNSAAAGIRQAEQALKDAERNLADTTLFSRFRGQVADVHVVPGSVVAQGTPVVTVQMMDPIQVEIRVSAEESHRLATTRQLPVTVTRPDGTQQEQIAHVYVVGPAADSATRTFSVTLLMLNEKVAHREPESAEESEFGGTRDLWRVDFDFLPERPSGTWFIEERSIHQDADGHFVWHVTNRKADQLPEGDESVLDVEKLRVTPGELRIPYLGNWIFRTFQFNDADFDPQGHIFAGAYVDDTEEDWDGDHMRLDTGGDWVLRPGDLVDVRLSGSSLPRGFYVPLDAIYEESGKTYVFRLQSQGDDHVAQRIPVTLGEHDAPDIGSKRQIIPEPDLLAEGDEIIVGGVHFLNDGEKVNPTGVTR